jgi:hypothetical protein
MAQGCKTGGRKKGSRNKKTVLLEEKGREALAEVLGVDAFDGDAHSLLVAIYKDESRPVELRLEAAKAAIRFEKPALAALDARGTIESVHYGISDKPVTEEEWVEQYTRPH